VRIAYVSFYDPEDIRSWSGTGSYIPKCLKDQGVEVIPIGPLRHQRAPVNVLRYLVNRRLLGKNDHPHRDPGFLRHYARQVHEKLATAGKVDLLFGPGVLPLVYVETDLPIVVWSDCTFASLKDYYAKFSNLSARTIRNGHDADRRALNRCDRVLMACQWAADSAVNDYGVDPAKVHVVPFGANMPCDRTAGDVQRLIKSRSADQCELLFVGVDWQRKGGDIAMAAARELNERGRTTRLTVVGCDPPADGGLPDWVRPLGFIAKSTDEGMARMGELLEQSHFLILPTQAECFGIVFCEASSFGVPSLSCRTGGVPTVVRDDVNGRLFAPDAPASAYADFIEHVLEDAGAYDRLAQSSFREYERRLNWSVAGRTVVKLLEEVCAAHR
jgi:glycosyltransferase involved in cell wall biosynthesis